MPQDKSKQVLTCHGAGADLEGRVLAVGRDLGGALSTLIEQIPGGPFGPVELARTLGVDKVLTSRVLKALRSRDPLARVYLLPGVDPLRRLVRAAARHVDGAHVAAAESALSAFEQLRREAGDRSALDAIISAWVPEARREFELRRKQAAFKAMSQLRGAMVETNFSTVLLHPSADGELLDVVWVFGLLGLQRLRPKAPIKLASRRITPAGEPRHPRTLDGAAIDQHDAGLLEAYCSAPLPPLQVQTVGEVMHYCLEDAGFGPQSAVDLVFTEVNLAEMPKSPPPDSGRKGYVFAEVGTPSHTLVFDVLVHADVYRGAEPGLVIYDTALEGVADVNDPARDVDRLDTAEQLQHLGRGVDCIRNSDVPEAVPLIREVCERLTWDPEAFRGYRCRIDYPIYGTQVAVTFDPGQA